MFIYNPKIYKWKQNEKHLNWNTVRKKGEKRERRKKEKGEKEKRIILIYNIYCKIFQYPFL